NGELALAQEIPDQRRRARQDDLGVAGKARALDPDIARVTHAGERGEDLSEVDVSRPRLEPLRVRYLDVAKAIARLDERRAHVGLFDVHVEGVCRDRDRWAIDKATEAERVRDRRAHVILIPVERLDVDTRSRALGAVLQCKK